VAGCTYEVNRPPITLPTTAAAVTIAASFQSICSLARCPAKPAKDCMEMTTREVPTATGIGSPPSSASAGTSRNPPPAPTRR
jgi:hypothetical protein